MRVGLAISALAASVAIAILALGGGRSADDRRLGGGPRATNLSAPNASEPNSVKPCVGASRPECAPNGREGVADGSVAGGGADAGTSVALRWVVRAIDEAGGPIESASVVVRPIGIGIVAPEACRCRTGADGRAAISVAWSRGSSVLMHVQVVGDGFVPEASLVAATPVVDPREVTFVLRRGERVRGIVFDKHTGLPIEGVRVTWIVSGGVPVDLEVSDRSGGFSLPGVPSGTSGVVRLDGAGYCAVEQAVRFDDMSPQARLRVDLQRGLVVTGHVVDSSGLPVPGAVVEVEDATNGAAGDGVQDASLDCERIWNMQLRDRYLGERIDTSVRSDALGRFRIDGLSLVAIRVKARSADDRQMGSAPVGDVAGPVEVRLAPCARIRVGVVRSDGGAVGEARVRLSDGLCVLEAGVDAITGVATLDGVVAGSHAVSASSPGCLTSCSVVNARPGEDVRVNVVLELGVAIDGLVVGPDGRGIAGATVDIGLPDGAGDSGDMGLQSSVRTSSDATGRFRVVGLRRREFGIQASAQVGNSTLATARTLRITAPMGGVLVHLGRLGRIRAHLTVPDGTPFVGVAWFDVGRPAEGFSGNPVDDGFVESSPHQDGRYVLRIEADGFAWMDREVVLFNGGDADLGDIRLERGESVSGRVIDVEGRAIVGATVQCLDAPNRTALAGDDGRYRIANVPAGSQDLVAVADGCFPSSIVAESGIRSNIEFRLTRPVRVSGRVVQRDGATSKVLLVQFRPVPTPTNWDRIKGIGLWDALEFQTDADGRFADVPVPPGEVEVFIPRSNGQDAVGRFVAPSGPVEIVVER